MDNIEGFTQDLIDWFRANEEQMIAAYDQQPAVARMNRQRAKASAGGDPRPSTGKGPEKGKGKGKSKGKH